MTHPIQLLMTMLESDFGSDEATIQLADYTIEFDAFPEAMLKITNNQTGELVYHMVSYDELVDKLTDGDLMMIRLAM